MKQPKISHVGDDFIITIPREFHGGRLDPIICAAITQALSMEGLREAIKYFEDVIKRRELPNPIEAAMEKKRKAMEEKGDQET
jgi:hypothetical protein